MLKIETNKKIIVDGSEAETLVNICVLAQRQLAIKNNDDFNPSEIVTMKAVIAVIRDA